MNEIERLELQIEELRDAIERSRRFALAGRASAVAGPALLIGFMLGLVSFTPARMIFAIALAIGGLVLTGGADIDPAFYGQAAHAETVDTVPERDEFERMELYHATSGGEAALARKRRDDTIRAGSLAGEATL